MAAGNCLDVVLAKVKRLEAYANQPIKEQRKVAHAFTNRELLFNRFEHLLQAVQEEVHAAITDYEANFYHSMELQSAHQRAKHGMARVCHLPVKLFLSRLQRYPSLLATSITGRLSEVMVEFGALHAGLMVGDIRVEWGAEGLIDPQWEDPCFVEEDFIAHVHQQGEWALTAASYDKKFSLADRERRIEDKIELIMDTAEEKRQLIMNLVDVIVRYNCTKQYCVMNSNCQHFVSEAMHALGIKSTPKFSGLLNDYLQKLKCYQIDIPEEFSDHVTLDAYVKPKLEADTLSQHDMEYLLLHYYRLHLDSLPKDGDIDDWRCEVHMCQYDFLAEKVNRQAMVCHQFLRQRTHSSTTSRVQRQLVENSEQIGDAMIKGSLLKEIGQTDTHPLIQIVKEKAMEGEKVNEAQPDTQVNGDRIMKMEMEKQEMITSSEMRNKQTKTKKKESKQKNLIIQEKLAIALREREKTQNYLQMTVAKVAQLETEVEEANREKIFVEEQAAELREEIKQNDLITQEKLAIAFGERDRVQNCLQLTEARVAQLETEVEEANGRKTFIEEQAAELRHRLQLEQQRAHAIQEHADIVTREAEARTVELSRQLQLEQLRAHAIQEHADRVTRDAEARTAELSHQLQLEQQRAHAIQEHADIVTRDAEAQLRQSQSYWMISRDEIEFTETVLGTGAYGTVKVATFRGSQVAVKCYHQILLSDHNLGLFRREITMATHLRHPNLVQFIGASVERELILVTELMTTSLDALMNHGQLSESVITSISLDVAQALNYLHLMRPQPIVHRDICRGNVLLDPLPDNKWKAKVSDYGSVNLLEHLTTRHPGNPFYEAPEAKDPDLQSPKMDIYSFGVLLAEMLTNELPEKKHRYRQILKIEIHHPNFIELVRQCLSEEIDHRPSAQDLIADLRGRY